MSVLFSEAMRLEWAGDGVYDGALDEHWTIGPKVHGGAMLALCANAARAEIGRSSGGLERSDRGVNCGGQERSDLGVDSGGQERSDRGGESVEPSAVSGNFLWAPDPGALRVLTTVRKRGRRISLVDVELMQGDRVAVRAAITLGVPEHDAPPLLSTNPVVPLMTPEPPPGLEPIGPGHRMADIVHLAHGCDIRPSLTTMAPRSDGGPPVIEYWVRPRGEAPDVLFALLCGDVSAPVTFGVNRFGWAPTVQLTAFLRARPADGWLRVLCTTTQIGQEWFDEDHVVVDSAGRIVVQTRQLALVPTS